MAKQPEKNPPLDKPQKPASTGKTAAAKPAAKERPAATGDAGAKASKPAEAEGKAGRKRRPVGVREEMEQMKEMGGFMYWVTSSFRDSPAFAFSAVIHMIVVILLALVTLAPTIKQVAESLTGTVDEIQEEKLEEIQIDVPKEEIEVTEVTETFEMVESETIVETPEISEMIDEAAPQLHVELDVGLETAPPSTLMNTTGRTTGTGLAGRGAKARATMVAEGGGSPGSEAAVGHALKWLAAHQMANGGWSFDHGKGAKHQGPVNGAGKNASETAATACALLPFLGAGQTHIEGEYKDVVKKGLYFLGSAMKVTPNGGDLRGQGGSMYAHGLAAITMCEAYALTQDKALMAPAQQSINYIAFAQDKTGGGWRYSPGQPGDTSAVGWQIMALKSGHLAYLNVDPKTVAGAINFLNIAQSEGGAYYGYTGPGKGPGTTAVGLLCRMYLGWKKDEPALGKGVEFLSKTGPSKGNMYYNYYATQVMRHYGGDEWTNWNNRMRDQLVSTQVAQGTYQQEKGSWTPPKTGHVSESGGRLLETSLSTMTLEVYYRYMPLYKEAANQDDF